MEIRYLLIAAMMTLSPGCTSIAVNSDHLTQRTAFTLGMPADDFTISERQDNGTRTDYKVKTQTGERYQCYVEGIFSVTGRIVSDAICNAQQSGRATPAASSDSCNALLKAAGRC